MPESFQLIDEQQDFVVVNKAANTNFHDEGITGSGLFNQVKSRLKLNELYPVHRLDKITSGLVVFAKNQDTAAHFQHLFSHHQVEKYYLAISNQKPTKKQGLIKGDMAKSRRGMWKLLRSMENPATTQFFSHSIQAGLRGFIVKPHTGKTHQIRVALASIGAPILGDPNYGKVPSDRGYLHAYGLRFVLKNSNYEYICPPNEGDYFTAQNATDWISSLAPPWSLKWPAIKKGS